MPVPPPLAAIPLDGGDSDDDSDDERARGYAEVSVLFSSDSTDVFVLYPGAEESNAQE